MNETLSYNCVKLRVVNDERKIEINLMIYFIKNFGFYPYFIVHVLYYLTETFVYFGG